MRSSVVLGGLISIGILGASASAAIFTFDGSSEPTLLSGAWHYATAYETGNPTPYTLQAVRFANCSWGTDGNVLNMATYPYQGIWIGNIPALNGNFTPNWLPSNNSVGNQVQARLAVSANAKEWSLYLLDDLYGAVWEFDHNQVKYYVGDANHNAVELVYNAGGTFDGTQFHTYEFILKNGQVGYSIDGQVIYAGPAYIHPYGKSFLIGDGTGSTPTGVGALTIDYFTINTAPTTPVPEPASIVLAGLVVTGLLLKRRSRATT